MIQSWILEFPIDQVKNGMTDEFWNNADFTPDGYGSTWRWDIPYTSLSQVMAKVHTENDDEPVGLELSNSVPYKYIYTYVASYVSSYVSMYIVCYPA